jgi:nitrogen regulatory protein PII
VLPDRANPHKLITIILPKGKGRAKALVQQLVFDCGVNRVNINHARGLGRLTPLQHRGVGESSEKEIVTVVVEESKADEIFEFIFYAAEINRPHGGLMFQQPLLATTLFSLPDEPEED